MILNAPLFSLLLATAALAAPTPNTVTPHQSGGKEHVVIISNDQEVPPYVEDVLSRLALNVNHPDVKRVFNNSAFRGFSANMKSHCLDLLANMSDVSVVEEAVSIESMLYIPPTPPLNQRQTSPQQGKRDDAGVNTRPDAPWGLERVSSTESTIPSSPDDLDYTYSFPNSNLGAGADIYLIDTGIYTAHQVFTGRATMAWSYDSQTADLDGHGTHVAGTAGGNILGVASEANIFGVRALDSDGGGWSSNVVAGIDFVIQQHDRRKANASTSGFVGSVMSMSLAASGQVSSINQAVLAAVRAGVHTCVAAGNSADDACSASPASAGGSAGPAITVGAVDINSQRASFSNYGSCVDVYAPGVDIISAWIGAPNMINSLSGTSMATPHVTGIVAYAMANNATLAADPGLMKEWVRMNALDVQGDGQLLLATNGVAAVTAEAATINDAEGVLGFSKNGRRSATAVSTTTTATGATARHGPWKMVQRDARRAYSSLGWSGSCARRASGTVNEKRSVINAWLCNAKRGLPGLDTVVSDAESLWDRIFG